MHGSDVAARLYQVHLNAVTQRVELGRLAMPLSSAPEGWQSSCDPSTLRYRRCGTHSALPMAECRDLALAAELFRIAHFGRMLELVNSCVHCVVDSESA